MLGAGVRRGMGSCRLWWVGSWRVGKGWLPGGGLSCGGVSRRVQRLTGRVVSLIQILHRKSALEAWPTWTGISREKLWLLMAIRT